ncbi:hypothetical protein PVAP13_4NG146405 [Panicum virgatum]|uniref:MADS-box domain-containing protein n=1 Tax=Panicum virgatum TaxID=38727 RepID=A0A8T0T924_PANVG|nr:hypothetical protein PVAP13_4NG146405 [Panicum virgatum]
MADPFGKRKEELKQKAEELSVLCGVDVALVAAAAAAGDGRAAADVWESREGVLARYRALGAEARAAHSPRVPRRRARQGGGQARPGAPGRARRARPLGQGAGRHRHGGGGAAAARRPRRRDTGRGGQAEGAGPAAGRPRRRGRVALLSFAAAAGGGDAGNGPQAMWGSNGFHFQLGAADDTQHNGTGYVFQQYTSGNGAGVEGYHLQMAPDMYSSADHSTGHLADACQQYQLRDPTQNGYDFQCAHASYFSVPSGYAQPSLPMWSVDDEPRHAMLPLEYPSGDAGLNYADTPAAQGGSGGSFAIGTASGNFVHPPPALSLAMNTTAGGGDGNGNGDFINNGPSIAAPSYTMGGGGNNFTNAMPAQPT